MFMNKSYRIRGSTLRIQIIKKYEIMNIKDKEEKLKKKNIKEVMKLKNKIFEYSEIKIIEKNLDP